MINGETRSIFFYRMIVVRVNWTKLIKIKNLVQILNRFIIKKLIMHNRRLTSNTTSCVEKENLKDCEISC